MIMSDDGTKVVEITTLPDRVLAKAIMLSKTYTGNEQAVLVYQKSESNKMKVRYGDYNELDEFSNSSDGCLYAVLKRIERKE